MACQRPRAPACTTPSRACPAPPYSMAEWRITVGRMPCSDFPWFFKKFKITTAFFPRFFFLLLDCSQSHATSASINFFSFCTRPLNSRTLSISFSVDSAAWMRLRSDPHNMDHPAGRRSSSEFSVPR